MASGSWKAGGVNPNATFLSQAKKTCFGSVLEERMEFEIHVDKECITDNLHHRIVISIV